MVSGLYWGLNTATLLGYPDTLDRDWILTRLRQCRRPFLSTAAVSDELTNSSLIQPEVVATEPTHRSNSRIGSFQWLGGYGGNIGHDPHLLYTLSAIQLLLLCDKDIGSPASTLVEAELGGATGVEGLVRWLAGLQKPDGSFSGDMLGEDDTRHSYSAVAALALLGRLHDTIDVAQTVRHILRCQTVDGAFGLRPGAESHAGHTFCCVAALSICGYDLTALPRRDLLLLWLSERQAADAAGVNGRPGKRPDVCYTWWVGATAVILGELTSVLNVEHLTTFILERQATATTVSPDLSDGRLPSIEVAGGLTAHVGDEPDLFHTMFGIASLGFLGYSPVQPIDPLFCLPRSITGQLQYLNS